MWIQIYDIVSSIFGLLLNVFYREIRVQGLDNVPKEGPVIFVAAPHANMFIDGAIFTKYCPREVSFVMAKRATTYKYAGSLIRGMHAITLERPKDFAEMGKGSIQLDQYKDDSFHVNGIGTEFTKQLKVGGRIALPNDYGSSEILEILSDTELVIREEFKGFKALEMLTQPNGTPYVYLPRVDQSHLYKKTIEVLNAGKCIGMLPEGRSHDRAELLPLKAGMAIVALSAMAENSNQDIKIVPCGLLKMSYRLQLVTNVTLIPFFIGLNYSCAHKFRSRAVVWFGSPISIPPELVEKYRNKGQDRKQACGKLLEIIYDGLKSVTVTAPDYETLMVIRTARSLYRNFHGSGIHEEMKLDQRFINGYMKCKDDPYVQAIHKEIMEYIRLLKHYGLDDRQVHQISGRGFRTLALLLWQIIILVLCFVLSLPGLILNLPLIMDTHFVSSKKAEVARKSCVMIAGHHVVATWKILTSFRDVPILYGLYTFIILFLAHKYHWNLILNSGIFAPINVLIILFAYNYVLIRLLDVGSDLYRSLLPLVISFSSPQSSIQHLQQIRDKLSNDVTELVNELKTKIMC
ncbi:7369_t:CDS:2 [Acaulospora morrowiae]|uniref:7369_t:CDS:1 n=1 Tax=Acaulospora morrowiae TaxID=94023 RepID=A0A9N9AY03_9GLOM|nr:7369_t:CDS:2 [Acaulospora morrowiae]